MPPCWCSAHRRAGQRLGGRRETPLWSPVEAVEAVEGFLDAPLVEAVVLLDAPLVEPVEAMGIELPLEAVEGFLDAPLVLTGLPAKGSATRVRKNVEQRKNDSMRSSGYEKLIEEAEKLVVRMISKNPDVRPPALDVVAVLEQLPAYLLD